jgi:acyl phosphate:glycerol-3-phosphate acyltransferase
MITHYSSLLMVAALAYLLGSIPFGYILVRIFRGDDVRESGSGNIGATNVARSSPALGIATLILDAAKGYAAVGIGFFVASLTTFGYDRTGHVLPALAALFAVLGHVFPIWLKFRGGKGVATGLGAFAALVPKAVLIMIGIFAALVIAFRYVSLASMVATAALPALIYVLYVKGWGGPINYVLAAALAASAIVIAKHRANISRLLAGTEHRFSLPFGTIRNETKTL